MRLMLCYLKFDWFCPSKIDFKVSPPFVLLVLSWFFKSKSMYYYHPIQPPTLTGYCVLQIRRLHSNLLFDCTSRRSSIVEGSKSNPSFFDVWFIDFNKKGEKALPELSWLIDLAVRSSMNCFLPLQRMGFSSCFASEFQITLCVHEPERLKWSECETGRQT